MPRPPKIQYGTVFSAYSDTENLPSIPKTPHQRLPADPKIQSYYSTEDISIALQEPRIHQPQASQMLGNITGAYADPDSSRSTQSFISSFRIQKPDIPGSTGQGITFCDESKGFSAVQPIPQSPFVTNFNSESNLNQHDAGPLPEVSQSSDYCMNEPDFWELSPLQNSVSSSSLSWESSLQSPLQLVDMNKAYHHYYASEASSPDERQRARKTPVDTLLLNTLVRLRQSNLSLLDVLLYILDEKNSATFEDYSNGFCGSDKFPALLDALFSHAKGGPVFHYWMREKATQMVCDSVSHEMESAKQHLQMSTADISLDYLKDWNLNSLMDPISQKVTPTWARILHAATETKRSTDSGRHRHEGRNLVSAQVHFLRSQDSAKIQIGIGLMLMSTGTARQTINVLHRAGITVSFNTLGNLLNAIAKQAISRARQIARGPFALGYDNINLSGSIYAEQTFKTMSKVQSGSFGLIYPILNAHPEFLDPGPMRQNLLNATPLRLIDLRPSLDSARAYQRQTSINICSVLLKYSDAFKDYKHRDSEKLKNIPRRPMPEGHQTEFYPLRATIIEEASIPGNILVQEDILITQLQHTPETLNSNAIPCVNDQLTNSRIRSIQSIRKNDLTPYHRRDILQVAPGCFHTVMNFEVALLHVHRGRENEVGSLTAFFSVLGKTRLGNDRPDFHALLMALEQVSDGVVFECWHRECGFPSEEAFAASDPTPDDLLKLADTIEAQYATPTIPIKPTEKPAKKVSSEGSAPSTAQNGEDHTHENLKRLMRDLLILKELNLAIAAGDFGRIEDLLTQMACIFRGAGSNNYSTEILHFIFNLKKVWTKEFANIMRDMMLVNISGLPGHAIATDMNIEHQIRSLKALFAAKGIYANWDRLGDISAAVTHLATIKKRVLLSTKANYQGSTHTPSDFKDLVVAVANYARTNKLLEVVADRKKQTHVTLVPDLLTAGFNKFASSSLETFNQKIRQLIEGTGVEVADEHDEVPVVDLPLVDHNE